MRTKIYEIKNSLKTNIKEITIKIKSIKKEYILCWIVSFILFFLPNCAKTPEQKELIKTGKAQLKIKLEGIVRPYMSAKILAPVSGTVEKVYFHNGDWVNKGDVIYKIRLDEIEMDIKNTKKEIKFIEESIRRNRSVYYYSTIYKKKLIEVAKTQLNRVATLYANGYATKRELEAAEEKYFRLLEDLDSIKNSYTSTRNGLIKQKHDLYIKLAKLEYKKSHAEVKAPISGFLTGSNLIEGLQVVKGTVVGKILNLQKVVVKAGVAPGLFRFLHKGQKVRIDFITTPPYHTYANIYRIIPIVDPKIGRMVAEIILDNSYYILQDGTKALVTIIPPKNVQSELYKEFYKRGSSIIEIKTKIR